MIEQVTAHFKGTQTAPDTVKFTHGGADFVLTDGTVYQNVDGQLGAGCKKVRTLAAVVKFVNARA